MNLRSCALSLPSLLLVGALALTGCGGSAAPSGSDAAASGGADSAAERITFEFGPTPDAAPGGEVTVQTIWGWGLMACGPGPRVCNLVDHSDC